MTSESVPILKGATSLVDIITHIRYREKMEQADYPDFIEMKAAIEAKAIEFANSKKESGAYWSWESLPPILCKLILHKYPTVNHAEITLEIAPNHIIPFSPSVSTEAVRQGEGIEEEHSVTIPIDVFGIEHQGPNVIDLITTLTVSENSSMDCPPRFSAIRSHLIKTMNEYPVETDYWETMIKVISKELLATFTSYDRVEMLLNVHPTATLTYPHEVTCVTIRAED